MPTIADEKNVFFFGSDSVFSQFHHCVFEEDGKVFNCSEQYMHFHKAVIFGDTRIADEILKSQSAREHKRLGRMVKKFDDTVWSAISIDVVTKGNMLKFTQNQHLKEKLLNSHPKNLAEASPYDKQWGIGLAINDPRIYNKESWNGENKLGRILTGVRQKIINDNSKKRMAEKRKLTDAMDGFVKTKKILLNDKMELKNDSILRHTEINTGLTVSLSYDHIMSEMCIILEKTKEDKQTCISLSEEEVESLICKLPVAVAVAKKYVNKKGSKPVDVPFDLLPGGKENQNAVLFVKQNSFGKQNIQLDVRRCYKKADQSFIYTKQGVRFEIEQTDEILEELRKCQKTIKKIVDQTTHLLKMAFCYFFVSEIQNLQSIRAKNCSGCLADHPTQDQHLHGCMTEWSVVVNEFWTTAQSLSDNDKIISIADGAISKLPNMIGLVSSTSYKIGSFDLDEIRMKAEDKNELEGDIMYKACMLAGEDSK